MVVMNKVCKQCGKTFQTECRTQKYCSDECKEASHYHGTYCAICGKPTKDNKVTCSKECYKIYSSKNCVFKRDDIKTKIKNTMISKYGADNAQKVEQFKVKSWETKNTNYDGNYTEYWSEKMHKTMQDKYGKPHALQCDAFKDKLENTIKATGISYRFHTPEWNQVMLDKYGTTVPYKNERIKNRGIQTLVERYGVTSPAKLDFVKEKMKNTCLDKYGVEYVFQSSSFRQAAKQTLIDKYGVENALQLSSKTSKLNKEIGKLLNVDSYEFPIETKRYDMKKGNTLFEVNPFVSHNSDVDFVFGIRDIDYHFNKTNLARKYGYRCFNIWDWDDLQKIQTLFCSDIIRIFARKCDVIHVDKNTSDSFLDAYHLQGKCQGDIIRVGLVYDNSLVGIMTFGNARYSNKAEIELLRLCYLPGYRIIGGSEKMFNFFCDVYHPNSIISYCDNSKFNGDVYVKLGFTKIYHGTPTAHWYNPKNRKHFTDNLLRKRGVDQLIGTSYGKGYSNEKAMLENGFVRIYDCGQSTLLWKNNVGDVKW